MSVTSGSVTVKLAMLGDYSLTHFDVSADPTTGTRVFISGHQGPLRIDAR